MESLSLDLPPIAIADDGELDDVRRLLERYEIPFLEAWSGSVPPDALRISSARYALGAAAGEADEPERRSFHIVIAEEGSPLRGALKAGPFDFVVQRPVHPTALRLLILHALYSGPERRMSCRVAMSTEVKVGTGLLPRSATLTQLSERGCGLVCSEALGVGDRTRVAFPRRLTGSRALSLEGRVVACLPRDDEPGGGCEISIAFRPPPAEIRERLRRLMASHGVGSAALHPRRARAAPRDSADASEATGVAKERRCSPRRSYCRPVLAAAKGAVHTIIGRDLSTGGMRVAPDARLEKGDEFKLVVYGRAGRTPLMVKAVVARDDGSRGCVLHFRDVGPSTAAALEEMVASLPDFQSGERGPNVVVSEVIEDA